MNKLRVILPGVWVFRLVLLLVGFCFAPCLASGQTEIPAEDLDGSHFTPLDDALELQSDAVGLADDVLFAIYQLDNELVYMYANASNSIEHLSELRSLLSDVRDFIPVSDYWTLNSELSSASLEARSVMDRAELERESLVRDRSSVEAVKYSLMSSVPDYQIVVGGTNTTDYTQLLTSILQHVQSVDDELFGENSDLWYYDVTLSSLTFQNFMWEYEAGLSGSYPSETDLGTISGRDTSYLVSNLLYFAQSFNLYSTFEDGIYRDRLPPYSGSSAAQELWAYLLRPYAQLLAVPDYSENPIINGFRSFYAGWPARYVYPTNTVDNPLFVSMPVGVDVETPIWVSFTNSVTLSSESLEGLQLSFSNAVDLSVLEDMIFTVRVTNADDLAIAILDEQEHRLEEALSDAESSLEEPSEETTPMPSVSFSFGSQMATHIRFVATSYKSMFSSIPDSPPADIMLWQGGNFGPVEVPSVHWKPAQHNSGLSAIRTLFSFAWYVIYVAVVFVSAAIDLMVCGVIVHMVYGLLLGRPDVAYHGMLWCYKSLCTFLGYKPVSVG